MASQAGRLSRGQGKGVFTIKQDTCKTGTNAETNGLN